MNDKTPPIAASDNKPKMEGGGGGNINIKWLVTTVLAIWPWLLGSIIISLIIGNLLLRYSVPKYLSKGEFLINDSKKGGSEAGDEVLEALKLNTNKINVDNEIEILKSRSTMVLIAKRLHLNINYSVEGRFKTTEIYKNRPFELVVADSVDDDFGCKVNIAGNTTYQFIEAGAKVITAKYDDTITS